MSLKYEPASEPRQISLKQLFSNEHQTPGARGGAPGGPTSVSFHDDCVPLSDLCVPIFDVCVILFQLCAPLLISRKVQAHGGELPAVHDVAAAEEVPLLRPPWSRVQGKF